MLTYILEPTFILITLEIIISFASFLLSFFQGGMYLINFIGVYGPGLSILFIVFVEAVGVFWFYGVNNFSKDIEQMLGKKPGLFWRICWTYISPVFLLVSIFVSWVLIMERRFTLIYLNYYTPD